MNDQNRSGQPGSLGDQGGSADNGSSDATANPFRGLEKGSLDWIEANGAKTVSDVVTMARNSEKLTGGIHLPGRDAPPEDISSFFDKTMGHFLPEEPSEYDFVMPENIKSLNVLKRCGFVEEGTIRKGYIWKDKGIVDLTLYSVLKEEYRL